MEGRLSSRNDQKEALELWEKGILPTESGGGSRGANCVRI